MNLKLASDVLSHPFTLPLVGAMISSYLIPLITRQLQDHQQELELKVQLVSEISESFTGFLMAIQFAEVSAKSQTQEDYDAAYKNWQIRSAVIKSKLEAYFPSIRLGSDWKAFSEVTELFYASTGIHEPEAKTSIFRKIRAQLGVTAEPINGEDLTKSSEQEQLGNGGSESYQENWGSLRNKLLLREAALTRRVLQSSLTLR